MKQREWTNGGGSGVFIYLFIHVVFVWCFFFLNGGHSDTQLIWILFSVLVLIIVIFSQSLLNLINIDLFDEFSPQWVREKT